MNCQTFDKLSSLGGQVQKVILFAPIVTFDVGSLVFTLGVRRQVEFSDLSF